MITVQTIVEQLNLEHSLSAEQLAVQIDSVAGLDHAGNGQLSFLSSAKYRRQLANTNASVVLISEKDAEHCPAQCVAITVADPYLAYACVSGLFDNRPKATGQIHPTAVIAESAQLGHNVSVGAYATLGEHVVIGDNAIIGAHCVVEDGVVIGAASELRPRVVIAHHCQLGSQCVIQSGAVIGGDGFGFARTADGWQPIAQVGRVIIGDRVHIGANSTVDRGAIADTLLADDVIIDNLVQIGHNVTLGKATALAGQAGVAGSANIGANCTIGGASAVNGHIDIVDNSHFTGNSMIAKGTTEPGLYSSGIPAQKNADWRKMLTRIRKLDSLYERISLLEDKLKDES